MVDTVAPPLTETAAAPAPANYAERAIDLTITLQPAQDAPAGAAPPVFKNTASNVVKVQGGGPAAQNGLHISARIVKAGGNSFNEASVRVYNLPLPLMNQLSTLGTPLLYQVGKNTITIEAGDAVNGMSIVFHGTITEAWAEFDTSGNAIFNISAFVAAFNGAVATPSTSYSAPVSAATVLADLAARGGYNFNNSGVTTQLPASYFSGSIINQIRSAVAAANIEYFIDDVTNTLAIWPKGGNRGGQIPLISAATGMVGYPTYTANGISFQCLFNPSIGYGGQIQLQSILSPACGTFVVIYFDYDLEVQERDGPWFMNVEAVPLEYYGRTGLLTGGI